VLKRIAEALDWQGGTKYQVGADTLTLDYASMGDSGRRGGARGGAACAAHGPIYHVEPERE